MPETPTWERFFDAHAPIYGDNVFTKNTVAVRERGFVPTELRLLFRIAGLSVLDMWGGTAGNWGRRPLDLDEIEIMIVACKTAKPSAAGESGR